MEKRSFWGRKRFPWDSVHGIEEKEKENYTVYTVWAEGGTIKFTSMTADCERLVAEIRQRTGEQVLTLPASFPAGRR